MKPAEPVPAPPRSVEEAQERVVLWLRQRGGGAVVALSGGTDSALLLSLAAEVLGPARVLAVTSRSESLVPEELADARAQARSAGVEHVTLAGTETQIEAFRRNGPDRCFHCKDHLYGEMAALAAARGLDSVLDGTNADDVSEHRPGYAAGLAHGVHSPLLACGLTKPWVRALSRARGLSTWDKPSDACLSSRIPYGTEVTPAALERVARAERALKDLGFRAVRVRDHDPVARIEVPPADLTALLQPGLRERAIEGVRAAGFAYVALDLEGYRSGSLLEPLRPAVPAKT